MKFYKIKKCRCNATKLSLYALYWRASVIVNKFSCCGTAYSYRHTTAIKRNDGRNISININCVAVYVCPRLYHYPQGTNSSRISVSDGTFRIESYHIIFS